MGAIAIILFFLGTIAGSFIGCVVDRLAKKEDIIFKRSYCPHCHHRLAWFDLIPIFSFAALKGRCRYCHQRIPWEYPLIEVGTGLLFVLIFMLEGNNYWLTIFLILVSIPLAIIFLFDLKHSLIPGQLVYPTLGAVLLFWLGLDLYQRNKICSFSSHLSSSITGLLVMGGFLGILYLITKGRGMGLGDVELGALLGAILGWPLSVVALFLSFFIGAILGTVLVILKRKKWKSEIPFGPFLILGAGLALGGGSQLISWYTSLL